MSRVTLSVLLIVGLVFPAFVSGDFVMAILEKSYKYYNASLSNDHREALSNFKAQVQKEGVVLTIDKPFVVPKYAYEKSVSKILIEKHGKYSPAAGDPNGLAQFGRDYNTFVKEPCDSVKKEVITATTAFYIAVNFNRRYINAVKDKPFLNKFIEQSRLCLSIFIESPYLVKSSYNYMVNHQLNEERIVDFKFNPKMLFNGRLNSLD